jgi:hypothetical protein
VSAYKWLPLASFLGGRHAAEAPISLKDSEVVQARNGDFFRTHLFRKRGGATAPSIGSVFTGVISSLISHLPSNNQALAELWGVDDATPPIVGRMAAATTFSAVTMLDAVSTGGGYRVRGASFSGKLYLAYDSAVDRMHVYDPTLSSPQVRRFGLGTPSPPTVADSAGGGTYPATIRYYRVRNRIKNGTLILAQSEPSTSVAFTPAGNKLNATVTKAAASGELETHWVLEGSPDNVTFFELSEIVVGTTTYLDTALVATYAQGTISAVAGAYAVATSWKYVIAAFNRVFGAGGWESGAKQSRVWYTTALGTTDIADDERIPNTEGLRNSFDIQEGTGGDITGFAGPIYGSVYVFKYSQIHNFQPTGASDPVFNVLEQSLTRGAIEQEAIDVGEDAQNRPCIYFLDSQIGPMVTGPTTPTAIGDGVRDQWDLVNLAATIRVGWVLDYPGKGQVWFAWAISAGNEPTVLGIYDKQTGGWTVLDTGGKIRLARAAVAFARTLGASMSRDLVPYVSYSSTANKLLRCDTTDTADDSTTFQALVKSKPYALNNGKPFRMTGPWILAKAQSGVTLTVICDADLGVKTQTGTILLTADGSEPYVFRQVEGIDLECTHCMQLSIGDSAAVSNTWQIDAIWIPMMPLDAGP